MVRNPLLYSDPSEIEELPSAPQQEVQKKSSFLFYFIILANSLLVLFVLGFIWFLFLKSPDIQIKEISDRLFGTSKIIEQAPQSTATPKTPAKAAPDTTQQEKDKIQRIKLKQMREKEELAAERLRLEKIKSELEKEQALASDAQKAIDSLAESNNTMNQEPAVETPSTQDTDDDQTIKAQQTAEDEELTTNQATNDEAPKDETPKSDIVATDISEPSSTTSSQVDLIMEALKNQQTENNN